MHYHIVSLFPESLEPYLQASILGRAIKKKKISVHFYNPRDFVVERADNKKGRSGKVDSRVYGGGPGMVMKAEPILSAVEQAKGRKKDVKVILFSPGGKVFTDALARQYAKSYRHVVFICGHYEGIDARVKKILKAEEISVGPYILTGGELPALTVIDALTRKIPGVLGNESSLEESRTASSEMYTRPEVFEYKKKKYRVPKVLLGGNHKAIETWRSKRKKNQ